MAKKFLALLRGINVGGNNIIGKEELKASFESLGLTNVRTYIQSGNILFRSTTNSVRQLTTAIEKKLSADFNYNASAVVLAHKAYQTAVVSAPKDWGKSEDHKHNALFLMLGHSSQAFLNKIAPPKPGIETVTPVKGVIFWSVAKKDQTRASLMKLAASPEYKKVTVRNHNTVFRLQELFDEI